MKEIKTCEEYVLNELQNAKIRIEELKAYKEAYEDLLNDYNDLINLVNEVKDILGITIGPGAGDGKPRAKIDNWLVFDDDVNKVVKLFNLENKKEDSKKESED